MPYASAASSSRFSLSALLATTMTGTVARRSSSAASSSAGVRPDAASTTNRMTSASEMARRAWSWTFSSMGSPGRRSRPPVSMTTNRRPFHSVAAYSRSRVVRARSSTIAIWPPTIRLNRVDLPTLGRPTMATRGKPSRGSSRGSRRWDPLVRLGATQAAPTGTAGRVADLLPRSGRPMDVLRYAGSATSVMAAFASASACCLDRGRARELADPSRDRLEVLDGRRGAARDAHHPVPGEDAGVGQLCGTLHLDRGLARDAHEPRQLAGVGRVAAAHHDHHVHLVGQLDGVLLAPDGHGAHGVDDLELMGTADHEGRELLELPGRLGALADERHALGPRDALPLLFLVHEDGVRARSP